MIKFSKSSLSGMTLIEGLLYIGIASLMLGVISAFAIMLVDIKAENQVRLEVDQQGTFIIEEVAKRISEAESVTAPAKGASGSQLTLATAAPSTNPTTVNLSSGNLTLTEASSSPVALHSSRVNVDSITYTNRSVSGGRDHIVIYLKLSYKSSNQTRIYQYNQEFYGGATIRK